MQFNCFGLYVFPPPIISSDIPDYHNFVILPEIFASKEMADNLIMGWTFYKKKTNTLNTGRLKFTDRNIEYLLSLHGDQNRLNIDIQCMAYIFKNSTL